MYKMTAKACEAIQPLPHNFAMPKVEPHPSDKKLARIKWKQRGRDVAAHTKHLKQLNKTRLETQVASQYVVVAATRRKHEALVTFLQNGTSWLSMYQTTVTACDELSSSRGREELAEAAHLSYELQAFLESCALREVREDPDMHGLNFDLRPCDLLVLHTEDQMASGHAKRFTGLRNLGNTCFVNATLQVFLHVEAFRSQVANPLPPLVVNAGVIGVATAKLRKVQQALEQQERRHASNKWSVLAPIRVLQAVFSVGTERYAMIAGRQCDAMGCFYIFCDSVGLSPGPQCWIPRPEQILQYPQTMDEGLHVSIAQLVHMLHPNEPIAIPVPPQTLVLGLAPFRMVSETAAEWVIAAVSGWDDTVDMSPFCSDRSQCTDYLVRAVVYHVHPPTGPANLRCGHYIAYLKRGDTWYLANDSQVNLVLMSGLRGLPYIVVLERINASEEDVVAKHDEGEPTEILVEIPAASDSASDPGTESNAESQLQADRKPVADGSVETDGVDTLPADGIKTCEALSNSTASRSQAPAETTARTSGDVRQATPKKRPAKALAAVTDAQGIRKYFKTAHNDPSSPVQEGHDRSGQQQDRSSREQDRSSRQQDQSSRQQDRSSRQQGRSSQQQDRSSQQQDRSSQQQDRSSRQQDRSDRERLAQQCVNKARKDVAKEVCEPSEEGNTAVGLFKKRYDLRRAGADDALRDFPDKPVPMPPVSCLMRGCEHRWFHNREELLKHCDDLHAGYQSYRNRVLHLLSQTVFQFPGSLQRAAMQNFAEFQCRSQTDWQHFTPSMQDTLNDGSPDDSDVARTDRWTSRSWIACCVCAMQAWQEAMVQAYVAGDRCCFSNFEAVADLLNPDRYIRTWPMVPKQEILDSAVKLQMPRKDKNQANKQTEILVERRMLLHKRRVSPRMCCGEERANLCHDCYNCLHKAIPEMPVNALANGRWLGRHPEIMRSMPYGHRLLLPVRRVVLTRVIFTANPKSQWERSHSQKGLDGVTAVVEQADASSSVLEYPRQNLGESFQAVFTGIDPDDTRKAQCFPNNKALFLSQHEFLQRHSVPNAAARFNAKDVAAWTDGVTPPVLQQSFVDAPGNEEDDESTEHPSSTKCRGPVDSAAAVRELGEHKEDVPWTFLCPDAADQELDQTAAWQIAQRKLEMIQEQALAIKKEEQLAQGLSIDKSGRKHLLNTCAELQGAVLKLTTGSFLQNLERALRTEAKASNTTANEETPQHGVDSAAGTQADESSSTCQWQSGRLVVPTGRGYAKMYEPSFWQEWDPLDWCYGDFLYGDPKLDEEPYKQPDYRQYAKQCFLREEMQYDTYDGENYRAEEYGLNHWKHDPDVANLLQRAQQAKDCERCEPVTNADAVFGVNRFRKNHVVLFVLSTFWRLMAGFTAVNIGMRIPGMQSKLKQLAELPLEVMMAPAQSGEHDGVMGVVRSASHLLNLIMGKVVGSNGYRIACRHEFSAYTIFWGAPIIFCTPNIADNRNLAILLTQDRFVNLDKDADMHLAIQYEELRLRVVNDPVGQSIIVHLFLHLFVLHILGARPECVAQPKNAHIKPRDWLTDGVAASLTSLGSMIIVASARGEMEASGRGSLHGHWEVWGIALAVWTAMKAFADLPPHEQVAKLRSLVIQLLNFFQRPHHSSVQHLPYIHGSNEPWKDPLPITKAMMDNCRLDGRADNFEGYSKQTRPLAAQHPLYELPTKLPADDLYEPQELPADDDAPPRPDPPERKQKTMRGETLSSFPQYRRIKGLKIRANFCSAYNAHDTSQECVCSDCWRQAHVNDSWHVQVRAMIHVCGPSCWKYNKNGTRICRHHCYHITVLEPDI